MSILSPVLAEKSSIVSREVGARFLPVPNTVSSEEQVLIAAPLRPGWRDYPKTIQQWKVEDAEWSTTRLAVLPGLRQQFSVKIQPTVIRGVKAFILTPKNIAPENKNRLLVNVHGGGYVFGSGEGGTREATLMAAYCQAKVIAIDYRMPPEFPFPAAIDDAITVWKELVKTTEPHNIAIVGCSAGGGIILAMVQRAKKEGLPLPGAIAPGTPWADLSKTGDTIFANEEVDNVLVTYDGWLNAAAILYANGHDLKDPLVSPLYGDFQGFPPTFLTTGTRDLFLSNTVRVHRKLRSAGVVADLHVFEGQSHGQYYADALAPETKEYFEELTRFLNQHLGTKSHAKNAS